MQTCNPSTLEAEAEGSRVWGQLELGNPVSKRIKIKQNEHYTSVNTIVLRLISEFCKCPMVMWDFNIGEILIENIKNSCT
jgi:hypothetical protein